MAAEQNIWGREQRRDGNSEWPSTSFSTLSGHLDVVKAAPRRRRVSSATITLALVFVLILLISALALIGIAQRLHA